MNATASFTVGSYQYKRSVRLEMAFVTLLLFCTTITSAQLLRKSTLDGQHLAVPAIEVRMANKVDHVANKILDKFPEMKCHKLSLLCTDPSTALH